MASEKQQESSRKNGAKHTAGKSARNAKVKEGVKFEDYVVIKRLTPIGMKNNKSKWECCCSLCGEVIIRSGHSILLGHKMKCSKRELRSHNWSGVGTLSGSHWYRITNGAEVRELKVTMTKEDAWNLYEKQNRRCVYSGLLLEFDPRDHGGTTASLDRIDSNKDYTIDNVQWVHRDINMMKRDFTEQYFKELCRMVVENNDVASNAT